MSTQTQPLVASSLISETEVVKKACSAFNLTAKRNHHGRWETADIGEYPLDSNLIKVLGEVGFTFEPGKEPPRLDVVYLAGHSHQTDREVFESDCWAWDRSENNPRLTISFHLLVSEKMRGLVAVPHVWGNCKGGACHQPTIDRLVRSIAGHFDDVHPLLKKMVGSNDYPVIQWNDINLGGLRSLHTLFRELYGHNEVICGSLAQSHFSPFKPKPFGERGEEYFVPEPIQHELMNQWEAQLQRFKEILS